MKRRFACNPDDDYSILEIQESFFKGHAVFLKLQNIEKPLSVYNGEETICIKDNNYEWIEVYPTEGKYSITIMYDDKGNLIEWYFDIAKKVGIENGIPFEDDLYLDLIITPNGEKIIIDEDELLEAKENGFITQDDVDNAYRTLRKLENQYVNNINNLKQLTNYLLNEFKPKIKHKIL